MDWFSWGMTIIAFSMLGWCFYMDCVYKKTLTKKTKEAYQRGFCEGVKTSKEFDATSFVDSKYAKYDSKQ